MAGQGSNAASGLEDSDQVGGYALWLAKGPMLLQAKKTKTLTRLVDMLYSWPRVQCC